MYYVFGSIQDLFFDEVARYQRFFCLKVQPLSKGGGD